MLPDLFAVAETCGAHGLSAALSDSMSSEVLRRISPDGRDRFNRFAAVIRPLLKDRGRLPLSTAVRGAWLALGGPACVIDPIDLDAADRFFALLAEHEAGADVPDWAMFMDALDGLRAEGDADPSTRVRIMTLHRAKGLEFDVVVMPGLARPPRGETRQLLLWRRRSHGLLLAPMKSRYVAEGDDDPVYSYLRAVAAAEEMAELARLLYVGCTRAKERLHLTSPLEVVDDDAAVPEWKPPAQRTALAALWAAIADSLPAPGELTRISAARAESGVPLRRLPTDWHLPPPPAPTAITGGPDSIAERDSVEFDWARETARRIGIVAHRLLSQLAQEGIEHWSEQRIVSERKRITRELAALGLTGGEVSAAVEQVLSAIAATIGDPRGRWLFDPGHEDARSEFALTGRLDEKFVHLVLDRTFVDGDGVRWIVDFKLSRHEGADAEGFLDREQERYRVQLETYAQVMRSIDPRPIRVALYFPLVAGWREWNPAFAVNAASRVSSKRWTETPSAE
jgi:ATP-dependent exoDNAse (exonuclease V) beta subunit